MRVLRARRRVARCSARCRGPVMIRFLPPMMLLSEEERKNRRRMERQSLMVVHSVTNMKKGGSVLDWCFVVAVDVASVAF
mmetsp:Transcript_35913/g.53523  ORF Transcript_35913/g.53523 Transcript_35913/m.53523 type:complete len:80 (+) Transcript_35913:869-1108(+)